MQWNVDHDIAELFDVMGKWIPVVFTAQEGGTARG